MEIKRFVNQKLSTVTTTDNSLFPAIKQHSNSNFSLAFNGSCLKQKSGTYTPPNKISFFIVYELGTWPRDLNSDFTRELIAGVKLAKNADKD